MRKRLSKGFDNLGKKDMFFADLDDDLKELLFEDLRLVKSKKKLKNKKARFIVGDNVEVNGEYGIVVYGPYPSDNRKELYEIEIEDRGIISVEDTDILPYVPPIEEESDDDLI